MGVCLGEEKRRKRIRKMVKLAGVSREVFKQKEGERRREIIERVVEREAES